MLARRSPSFATQSGDIFFKPLLFVSFPTVYTKLESVFFGLAKLFPVICWKSAFKNPWRFYYTCDDTNF